MHNDGVSTNQPTKEINIQTPAKIEKDETTSTEEISEFRRALPQILASSAKNMILMDLGMTIAFPSIVIPALIGNNTYNGMHFSSSDASWFGSIAFICQPIGSILSGIVLEPLGRKCSLLIVNFPHILGWLLFYSAKSEKTMFIANIIMGLGVGFMEAPIITYVGEICEPRLRGILISYSSLFFSIGVVIITGLGNLTDWQTTALISTLVPIITVIAITQVPETPYWLLSRGRYAEAEKSLCWLRGWVKPYVVQNEFQEMIRYSDASKYVKNNSKKEEENNSTVAYTNPVSIEDEKLPSKQSNDAGKKESLTPDNVNLNRDGFVAVELQQNGTEINKNDDNANNNKLENISKNCEEIKFTEYCKDLMRPEMLKPLSLVIAFFFVINYAGIPAIRPYQVEVFKELGFPMDGYRATVLMSVVAFVSTVLCMLFVRCLGKRPLSLISLFITSATLYMLSLYAKLNKSGAEGNIPEESWLPFCIFFVLQFFFSFGVSPVPWMLVSEVFPFRGRSLASGFAAACSYVLTFSSTKTFLSLESTLSLSGVLFLYGSCSFIGFIGMYIFLPETEGRTLKEIEDSYSSAKKQ